mmetsp:Transcript_65262/g.155924  ORF Transcript_65262/g.155924 Transcript_65262/m.155924 type:complete len:528 (+) Transcript_65262:966-2549(+)
MLLQLFHLHVLSRHALLELGNLLHQVLSIRVPHGLNKLLQLGNSRLEGVLHLLALHVFLGQQLLLEIDLTAEKGLQLRVVSDHLRNAPLLLGENIRCLLHLAIHVELKISDAALLLLQGLLEVKDLLSQQVHLHLQIHNSPLSFTDTSRSKQVLILLLGSLEKCHELVVLQLPSIIEEFDLILEVAYLAVPVSEESLQLTLLLFPGDAGLLEHLPNLIELVMHLTDLLVLPHQLDANVSNALLRAALDQIKLLLHQVLLSLNPANFTVKVFLQSMDLALEYLTIFEANAQLLSVHFDQSLNLSITLLDGLVCQPGILALFQDLAFGKLKLSAQLEVPFFFALYPGVPGFVDGIGGLAHLHDAALQSGDHLGFLLHLLVFLSDHLLTLSGNLFQVPLHFLHQLLGILWAVLVLLHALELSLGLVKFLVLNVQAFLRRSQFFPHFLHLGVVLHQNRSLLLLHVFDDILELHDLVISHFDHVLVRCYSAFELHFALLKLLIQPLDNLFEAFAGFLLPLGAGIELHLEVLH